MFQISREVVAALGDIPADEWIPTKIIRSAWLISLVSKQMLVVLPLNCGHQPIGSQPIEILRSLFKARWPPERHLSPFVSAYVAPRLDDESL